MKRKNIYSYDSIQPNELRLLRFIDDQGQLTAVLKTFSIDQTLPPYQSLSYAWACVKNGYTKTGAVVIDNQELSILASLHVFFQALRTKSTLLDGSWWWIDSICIDQANLIERAQQVKLMHTIYRQAQQAIIWLGEESEDSYLAASFINTLHKAHQQEMPIQNIRAIFQIDDYSPHWRALSDFFSRKWWSRIWTIQEFVIPQTATFWCGLQEVSRLAVCNSLWMADKCPQINLRYTPAFRYGFNRARVWKLYNSVQVPGVDATRSLVSLAAYFSSMDATDDRDRLYGLMAIASDAAILQVDYSSTSQDLYLRFAQAFIRHHKSLDIICFASTYSTPSESLQRSWVPDWQKRYAYLVVPSMVSQSCKSHIGNLRAPQQWNYDSSVYFSASSHRPAEYEFQGSALLARGVILDEVDGLAGTAAHSMVQSSEWKHSDSTPALSSKEILLSICKSLVLDRKDRFLGYKMPSEHFLQDFVALCRPLILKSSMSSPKEVERWFDDTKSLTIHGQKFEDILRDYISTDTENSSCVPSRDEYVMDSFFGRFFDTVVRMSMRLMFTRYGRIGATVEKASKGDLICVLFGCSVPVLLRKNEHEDSYIFIGECFLDGCMDGAVLDEVKRPEITFHIQ